MKLLPAQFQRGSNILLWIVKEEWYICIHLKIFREYIALYQVKVIQNKKEKDQRRRICDVSRESIER